MKYSCYIIDDEPLAIRVIEEYIKQFSEFVVAGTSTDPVRGFEELKATGVDLLFLDIEMPGLTGLDLIRSLEKQPEVIVTTAYREYAAEGFELNLLDYLVKPIPFPRFVKAIDRFLDSQNTGPQSEEADHMFVRADRKSIRLDFNSVLYIQGVKDYVKIVTTGKNIITKMSVGQIEEELPDDRFMRVHKSYIVSRDKVTAITNHDIELGDIEIPIGRTYKEAVQQVFGT